MNRIALGIEYDGSHFHGWQRQAEASSVQAAVEKALSKVADHPVVITTAGRTDAGVHATAQVIHFDSTALRSVRAWVYGVNTILPPQIRVLWALQVPDTFNARYSAVLRRYRYVLYNHPIRPSLLKGQVGWYYGKLDSQIMAEASQFWLGEQDFSSFRTSICQSKSPIRNLKEINVRAFDELIIIDVAANAFLHHMVRNMVGSLIIIGSGLKTATWAKEILEVRDRRQAGFTAPASGLYLVAVEYPPQFALPKVNKLGPWFLKLPEETFTV
jgi:tRNA pseudouridine38-40 synthase